MDSPSPIPLPLTPDLRPPTPGGGGLPGGGGGSRRRVSSSSSSVSTSAKERDKRKKEGKNKAPPPDPQPDGGNESPVTADPQPPPRSPSPDNPKCAICLGDVVNKSFSNSCMHQFCFGCLLEWSKVKPECPLCKSRFQSIYHNIRTNAEYDEYEVPPPVPQPGGLPSFSIRVSSGSIRSPELVITRGSSDFPAFPSFSHSAYSARLQRDPRIRLLVSSPFGSRGPADQLDVVLGSSSSSSASQSQFPENPFLSNHEQGMEFFGNLLDHSNRSSGPYSAQHRFIGYQTRRRRYDRNQWVQPFDSTLMAGTVFFPSIEYFQRHPSAMRRISPWLHRELTVLMNLSSSRSQMVFAYDLIMSLLPRYDIRSAEFRDLVRPYLGTNSRHFQHEFYYFVLSGMRMEEYDNIAVYSNSNNRSSAASSSTTAGENPFSATPTVVTIDSDDPDPDDENEIMVEDTIGPSSSSTRRNAAETLTSASTNLNFLTRARSESEGRGNNDRRSTDGESTSTPLLPVDLSDFVMEYSPSAAPLSPGILDIENTMFPHSLPELIDETDRSRPSGRERPESRLPQRRSRSRDPQMPVLEPQVDLNILNNLSSSRTRSSRRSGNSNSTSTAAASSSSASTSHSVITNTAAIERPPRPRPTRYEEDWFHEFERSLYGRDRIGIRDYRERPKPRRREERRNFDPADGRRSPYPRGLASDFGTTVQGLVGFPATSGSNPHDFAILRLREERRQREEEARRGGSMIERAMAQLSSVQVRIFPPSGSTPVDLSTTPGFLANQASRNEREGNPTPPRTPTLTLDGETSNGGGDDDDLQFLGVHPIIKKPPLAVITISESDEDDDGSKKNESESSTKETENTSSSVTSEPQPGTSAQLKKEMAIASLPPKRRYLAKSDAEAQALQNAVNAFKNTSHSISTITASDANHASSALMNRTNENRKSSSSSSHSKSRSRSRSRSVSAEARGKTDKSTSKVSSSVSSKRPRSEVDAHTSQTSKSKGTSKPKSSKADKSSDLDTTLIASFTTSTSSAKTSSSISYSAVQNSDIDILGGDTDDDGELDSKSKKLKKKKSKRSKSGKSKSRSRESRKHETSPERKLKEKKRSDTLLNPKHKLAFGSSSSKSKLKSVVVKVDKDKHKIRKPSSRTTTSNAVMSSSSEDSDDDNFPKPRIRSVVSCVGGSVGSTPSTVTSSSQVASFRSSTSLPMSQDNHFLTPSAQTPELQDPSPPYSFGLGLGLDSFSSSVRPVSNSRRWESDDEDDEGFRPKSTVSSECGSLLSVGGEESKIVVDDEGASSSNESNEGDFGFKKRRRLQISSDDDSD